MVRQGKFFQGIKLLERAQTLAPANQGILVDLATAHIWRGYYTSSPPEQADAFSVARRLLDEAEQLGKKFAPVFSQRAMLLYFQGDYSAAWRNIEKAEAIDPRATHPRFLEDLSNKMARPAKGGDERREAAPPMSSAQPTAPKATP